MERKNKAGFHSWGFSGKCSFQSLTLAGSKAKHMYCARGLAKPNEKE